MKTILTEKREEKRKQRVMFAIAPWDMWGGEDDSGYPTGIAYLAAVLEREGYEVSVLNLTYTRYEDVIEDVKRKIKEINPDIFGINIMTNSRNSALKLLNVVKEINPNIPIIAGGVHTTILPEQVLNNFPVDFLVLGEGEITLTELVSTLKEKKPLKDFKKIKGIAFKYNGEILTTEKRERIRDLDSLPIPKHELFSEIIEKSGEASVMTSRGCPYACSFCPSSVHWGRYMIQRSVENVFKEVQYLIERFPSLKSIFFFDDEFICNKERVIKLCKMMIDNNVNIGWTCLGRVTSIDEELVSWMKRAGCKEMIFGVESGSQKILDALGKKVKIHQIVEAFRICKKYKIPTRCLTIIGLPGENSQTVKETIKLVKKVRDTSEPAILLVFPGTRIYEIAKEKGVLDDEYWLSDKLVPFYTGEHSKMQLWWWSFKVGFYSRLYAKPFSLFEFFNRKILQKLDNIQGFKRIFKRYVTNKTD
ncbi:MAG: radical SAM protein [archaeon]